MNLSHPKNKEEARQQAIDWQQWISGQNLSYGEIIDDTEHFRKTGKRFGLLKEFKENGII